MTTMPIKILVHARVRTKASHSNAERHQTYSPFLVPWYHVSVPVPAVPGFFVILVIFGYQPVSKKKFGTKKKLIDFNVCTSKTSKKTKKKIIFFSGTLGTKDGTAGTKSGTEGTQKHNFGTR